MCRAATAANTAPGALWACGQGALSAALLVTTSLAGEGDQRETAGGQES